MIETLYRDHMFGTACVRALFVMTCLESLFIDMICLDSGGFVICGGKYAGICPPRGNILIFSTFPNRKIAKSDF